MVGLRWLLWTNVTMQSAADLIKGEFKARTLPIVAVLTGAALTLAFAQLAAAQFADFPTQATPAFNERSYNSGFGVENPKPGLSSPPWRFPPDLKPETSAAIQNSNSPVASEYESASSFSFTNAAFTQAEKKPAAEEKKPEKTYPDFKVTGFFQLDAAYFGQSAASFATLDDIKDGLGFRRARVAATGNISERASYMMEFDFAQAQARFVDVWGQVADTPLGKMRIGRFRQPTGMTELTSVRELPFLERPTLFALTPFRQTGIMFFDVAEDKSRTYAVSGFRTISDNFGNVFGEDGGYGLASRFTFLPIDWGEGRVVHFGFDYSFSDPARNVIQYATVDEVFVGQQPFLGPSGLSVFPIDFVTPFVNTGVFTVDNVNLFNLEAAAGWGRTVIQTEFRLAHVSVPGGSADLPGAYIHIRHMLTGESIPYNYDNAVFGRVKPLNPLDRCNGKFGAWEIAARLSYLDLNPALDLPGVTGVGRRLTSGTLGLNWYWWNNAKAQFNWIIGDLNDRTKGNSTTNTFAARLQFDF